MGWLVIIILISAACYGFAFYLNKSQENRLKGENKIIDRSDAFFRREHYFETSIASLKEIGDAIDKTALSSESISFEPNYERGIIIFHNNVTFGTFGAALRANGLEDESYVYRFKIDAWQERDGGITRQDKFGANVLLTAIEKAVLKLDPQARVHDESLQISTKHSLF